MHSKFVVVGCGYVGQRLLQRDLLATSILGVSRHRPDGSCPWLCIDLDTDVLDALIEPMDGAVVFYFAPPSSSSLRDDRSRRLLAAMEAQACRPKAVVLISTTGVYGDCAGSWVDENTPLQAVASRSIRRVDAELVWGEFAASAECPLAVLRVAGIYGPGKLPLARLSKSQPLLLQSQSPYSNRVHVDDLLDSAVAAVGLNTVINVADGAPSTMTAYFHELADAVGVARLPEADRESLAVQWSQGLRSYMSESRRVDNARMKKLLGGGLRYPNLAAGLAASVAKRT
ncbi:MAG: NAD-dependent epimerase/dehydratase family protein [Granulosicoccaceae bacterium]